MFMNNSGGIVSIEVSNNKHQDMSHLCPIISLYVNLIIDNYLFSQPPAAYHSDMNSFQNSFM